MADSDKTIAQETGPGGTGGLDPTLTPPTKSTQPSQARTFVDAAGSPLSLTSATQLSLPVQDLSGDALLASAPRIAFDNHQVPSLGGIPLLARLGQGGMGAVYYGVKTLLRQEVAVKVLPLHLAQQNPDMIARFVREAQIAATIESPRLVHVTDVAESGGLFYLVMEFVKGQSAGGHLKALLHAGKQGLDEAAALDACIAATEGLAAAHRQGVVHRDVKPDNILVPQHPRTQAPSFSDAKIADLGLARAENMAGSSLTGADSAMGTPGYMAPEQALNARKAGKPADVFAMGATLYALLTGRSPFKGETATEAVLAVIQKPHTPLNEVRAGISPATTALIDRCLAKEPTQRYIDAVALLEALRVCRKALGDSGASQAAMETLIALQKSPETGQALKPASSLDAAAPPVVPGSSAALTSNSTPPITATASSVSKGGSPAKWVAIVAMLVLAAGVTFYLNGNKTAPSTAVPPAASVEIGIACGHEKIEWVRWAIDQFASSPQGKGIKVNLLPMNPWESQKAIMDSDRRVHLFAPASGLYKDGLIIEYKEKYHINPLGHEENVALTPLAFLMFDDRYQAFLKKYKELNFKTLNDAMRTKGWDEISGQPDWGPFTFTCADPTTYNNGLSALTLMAYDFANKYNGLTVDEVKAAPFQSWGRAFIFAFSQQGSPAELLKKMVLKGPSAYDVIFTYESAIIANLKNFEGRWGDVHVLYPKVNIWNENPFYVLATPWVSDAQRKSATDFVVFLMTEPIQRELLKYGFRPGNPNVHNLRDADSPFELYKKLGLRAEISITVETPSDPVLDAIYESAEKWLKQ
jgi:serine/threonine protein kinase